MLIDGNNMIEMLSLPEWDDRIIDMLEEFAEKRPVLGINDTDVFIMPDGYNLQMMFDERCITDDQLKLKSGGNLYLNQISINQPSKIILPFKLEFSDSYEIMSQKIGRKPDFRNKRKKEKFNWLLEDDSKKYFLHVEFEDEDLKACKEVYLSLFDGKANYSRGTEENI